MDKKKREKIKEKTISKCGYCGILLDDKFQIDHIVPKYRSGSEEDGNLIASCRSCNNYKKSFSVEEFREEIGKQIERLNKYNCNYKLVKRFNLITELKIKVVFYYEFLFHRKLKGVIK